LHNLFLVNILSLLRNTVNDEFSAIFPIFPWRHIENSPDLQGCISLILFSTPQLKVLDSLPVTALSLPPYR
jgi:hypothetical protein